jgi:transcriptional regulator GlxA family with amidase domain
MSDSTVSHKLAGEMKVRRIAFVAFDGMEIIDLTGPMDVFAYADQGLRLMGLTQEAVYPTQVLAKQPGPVLTGCGLRILADGAYGEIRDDIDTLIILGTPNVKALFADPSLQEWVHAMSTRVRWLVAICTGTFLLAKIGLLNGRGATTHWAYCDRLVSDYPQVSVERDRIFLRDGPISTSGGVTAGIDLALSLVEEDWGQEHALWVARFMVMFMKRPGGQSQFSGYLISESTKNTDLRQLQRWIMDHPSEDLSVESLAARVAMSARNFARVFQAETGMTPAKFVEKARVDAARHLMGVTDDRIEQVAVTAGFGDSERMRRAFIRHLGISPHDYRSRFGLPRVKPTPVITQHREATRQAVLNAF